MYSYLACLHPMMVSFGTLTVFFLYYMHFPWKSVFIFPVLLISLKLVIRKQFFDFDSPAFLIQMGRYNEFDQVIAILYESNQVIEVKNEIFDKVKLNPINTTFLELFSGKLANRLRISLTLSILHQLAGFGCVVYYASEIF